MPGEDLPVARRIRYLQGGVYGNQAGPVQTVQCKNTSAITLTRGMVVIIDTTNSTLQQLACTTTTGAKSTSALGVVYDPSIAVNGVGSIQIWGPHDAVVVVAGGWTQGHVLGTSTNAGSGADSGAATQAGAMGFFLTTAASGATAPCWISRLDFGQLNP